MFTPLLWIVKVANLGIVLTIYILISSGLFLLERDFTLVVFFVLSLGAFHNLFPWKCLISDRFLASIKRSQVC